MNLEQTAAALMTQFPGGKAAELDRAEERLEHFGRIAFGGFGLVVAGAILFLIYMIIIKMILPGTQILPGIAGILALIFAALALTYVYFQEDLKEKRKKLRSTPVTVPEIDRSTNELLTEGTQRPVVSVVEDTTDLLPVRNRTQKLDR